MSSEKDAKDESRYSKPYWYQDEAIGATINYFSSGTGRHPLIVLPTGAGKSHVLGKLVEYILARWADQFILVITHREKLIEQDHRAICNYWDESKIGMYSAGLGLRQRRKVCVAGIQSIWRKPELFSHYTLILVDEAHIIPHGNKGQYRTFIKNFSCPVIGLTATHFRTGTGYLHEGSDRLFDGISYECDIELLIEQGYLCKLIPRAPLPALNTDGLHTQAGDFVKSEMVDRFDKQEITAPIIDDIIRYKDIAKKWLVFAIDIDHCEHIAEMLRSKGVDAQTVHSRMSRDQRTLTHDLFAQNAIQALVSVETLTTGFDDPDIDLIGLIRPTRSPVLHIQMIGRGLRIAEGKQHCIVLDYAGNIQRLGPINDVHIPERGNKKKKTGKPITRVCPECRTINYAAARFCVVCNHEFPRDTHLNTTAGEAEIIRKKPKGWPRWYEVQYMSIGKMPSNPNRMRISFRCVEGMSFYKILDTEQDRISAAAILSGNPVKIKHFEVADFIYGFNRLRTPKRILVKRRRTYPYKEIIDYEF